MYLLVILGIYLVVMFVISMMISTKKLSGDSFMVGNRKENWIMVAFSIAATWIWAPAIFVSAENAYKYGIWGFLWFFVPNVLTLLLFIPFAIKVKKACPDGMSIVDYITQKYGKKVGILYKVILTCVSYLSTAVQLLAGATIVASVIGGQYTFFITTVIMAVGVFLYSFRTGFKASVVTDVIQMISMIMIALLLALCTGGMPMSFVGTLSNNSFVAVSLTFGISTAIGLVSGILGDQCFWQRAYAIDNKDIPKAFGLAAFLFAIIPACFGLIGFVACGCNVAKFDMVLIIQQLFNNPIILPIYFICLLSGLMSTMDSNISAVSSLMYKKDDKKAVRNGRLQMIFMLIAGVVIANIPELKVSDLFLFYGAFRSVLLLTTILSTSDKIKHDKLYVFIGILAGLIVGVPMFAVGTYIASWELKLIANCIILFLPAIIPAIQSLVVHIKNKRIKNIQE